MPPRLHRAQLHSWLNWATLFTVGKPLLIGSFVCSAPVAIVSYVFTKQLVACHQRKKQAHALPVNIEESPPS